MLDFDDVLVQTGEFGLYQKYVVWLLVISGAFMNAFSSFAMVFVLFTPEFRCKLSPNDTDYFSVSQILVQSDVWKSLDCSIEVSPQNSSKLDRTIECPYGYVYDTTYFDQTIITQWDYVCDSAVHPRTVLSVMTLSGVLGDYVLGFLQDRYGRKFGFTLGTSMYVVFGLAMLLSPNLWVFGLLGAAQWFPGSANYNAAYVWALEFAGPSKRTFITAIVAIIYSFAAASMALIAYLFRTWTEIMIVTTVPFAVTLLFYWILAESPRWLLSKGRYEEFRKILTTIARWDKKQPNQQLIEEIIEDSRKASECSNSTVNEGRTRDLFTRPNICKKSLIVTLAWCINSLVYYVISYNVENLGGNFYVAYALQASIEAPASLLSLYTVNRFGRIPTLFFGLLISAVTSLLSTPGSLWPSALIIGLVVASKFGISLSYNVLYQVAAELYPTVVRARGLGFSTLVSDGLSVLIPYVVYSATDYQSAPMIIMGSLCFFGAFSVLFLPETLNQRLLDTIEESERLHLVSLATLKKNIPALCCIKKRTAESQDIPIVIHM